LLPERKAQAEPAAKSRLRHLNEYWFSSLRSHARPLISAWRDDYNLHRPHTSLDGLTPQEFLNRSAHSDVSGRSFRQHPVSHSGVSGHLRIVAA
jgi:transposase InsO family protein